MTARVLASPEAEIRRLRAERDDLAAKLIALVESLPDPDAEVRYRRVLCAEAAEAEREHSWSEGYAAAIDDMKRAEHDVVRAVRFAGRRLDPGGAAWLAAVERHGGTEFGGVGKPRVRVALEVIERGREAARTGRAA